MVSCMTSMMKREYMVSTRNSSVIQELSSHACTLSRAPSGMQGQMPTLRPVQGT